MKTAHTMSTIKSLRRLALLAVLSLCGAVHAQTVVDLSPEQKGRLRAPRDEAAIAALSKDFKFVKPGVLTVAIHPGAPRRVPMPPMPKPSWALTRTSSCSSPMRWG